MVSDHAFDVAQRLLFLSNPHACCKFFLAPQKFSLFFLNFLFKLVYEVITKSTSRLKSFVSDFAVL